MPAAAARQNEERKLFSKTTIYHQIVVQMNRQLWPQCEKCLKQCTVVCLPHQLNAYMNVCSVCITYSAIIHSTCSNSVESPQHCTNYQDYHVIAFMQLDSVWTAYSLLYLLALHFASHLLLSFSNRPEVLFTTTSYSLHFRQRTVTVHF